MPEERCILDTNVLFSGLYSARGASYRILELIEQERVKTIISPALVFEYEEILRRKKRDLNLSDADIDVVLDNLCLHGEHRKIYFLWRPHLRDPKDDHILELAVAADRSRIVTHNTRDFEGAGLFGIEVMKPREFLQEIE